mgnify:CR=1 FL=1
MPQQPLPEVVRNRSDTRSVRIVVRQSKQILPLPMEDSQILRRKTGSSLQKMQITVFTS